MRLEVSGHESRDGDGLPLRVLGADQPGRRGRHGHTGNVEGRQTCPQRRVIGGRFGGLDTEGLQQTPGGRQGIDGRLGSAPGGGAPKPASRMPAQRSFTLYGKL